MSELGPCPQLTTAQLSLLLYLETRAVDHDGGVDGRMMNEADFKQAKQWNQDGFLRFGRVASSSPTRNGTYWVHLTVASWAAAHAGRKERAERRWKRRAFLTTDE